MKINVKNGYGKYWAKTVDIEHNNIKIDIGQLGGEESIELALSLLDSCIDLVSINHDTEVGHKYEEISNKLRDIYEEFSDIKNENKIS